MPKPHTEQKVQQPIGRHSIFRVRARFTIDGQPVDLETDSYTAEAFVKLPDGTVSGGRACTISGEHAIYQLQESDMEQASTGSGSSAQNVEVTIVASRESPKTVLVSDRRVLTSGDWAGAEGFGV